MNWDNLQIVLAISKAKSLTRAGRLLGMDQTTIGRRLSAIEHDTKSALFIRSKAGFVPTEIGLIVIEHAHRMELELGELKRKLSSALGEVSGVVRVLANPWMLSRLSGEPSRDLLKAHPHLELRLSARLPPVPIYSEPTISLWFDADPREGEIAQPLCRIPYGAYLATDPRPDERDWVEFRDDDATGRNFTRQIRKRRSDGAKVKLTATDAGALLEAVKAGIGIGILPTCVAAGEPGLEEHKPEKHRTERILHVHAETDVFDNPKARIVTTWLSGVMKTHFGALPIGRK